MLLSGALQELYSVEHFAFKTVAITFWRLPVIFLVMFLVRGKTVRNNCLLCPALVMPCAGVPWACCALCLLCPAPGVPCAPPLVACALSRSVDPQTVSKGDVSALT